MTTESHVHCKAVIDANVLAPVIKRTLIRALADHGLLTPVISERILFETTHALGHIATNVTEEDKSDISILRTEWARGWTTPVETDLVLPDPDDAHVIGAALAAGAGMIVTDNIRDFPKKTLAPLGLHVKNADQFVFGLLESSPDQTRAAISTLPVRLPDIIEEETLPAILKRAGLRRVTKALSASI